MRDEWMLTNPTQVFHHTIWGWYSNNNNNRFLISTALMLPISLAIFSSILLLYNTSPPSSTLLSIAPTVPAFPPEYGNAESIASFRDKQFNNAAYICQKVLTKSTIDVSGSGIRNEKIPIDIVVKYILKKPLLHLLQTDKNNYDIAAILMVIASCGTLPFSYTIADINLFNVFSINRVNSTISVVPENNRIKSIGQISPGAIEDADYAAIRPLLTDLIKSSLALFPLVQPTGMDMMISQNPIQNTTYNLNAFAMMVIVKLGTALLDTVNKN
jgi:hypothetical protein